MPRPTTRRLTKEPNMKITMIAVLSITAAAAVLLAVVAHADPINSYQFLSPSGDIGCTMVDQGDGNGEAVCTIRDHTWVEPRPGFDALSLDRGGNGACPNGTGSCLGPGMVLNFFTGPYTYPALGYGQTHTEGPIMCESEATGVTYTDSRTGHFFRVSRDSYQLG